MLPALEQRIGNKTSDSLWNETVDRAIRSGPFRRREIRLDVVGAFKSVNRFDFLSPLYQLIDERVDSTEAEAKKDIDTMLEGKLGSVMWVDPENKEIVTTTATGLMIGMVNAGIPDDTIRDCAFVIGSGSGYIPAVLSMDGYRQVVGCELNDDLVRISSGILAGKGHRNVSIVEANALEWVADQGNFDTILSFAHIVDANILSSFISHLRIGGRMVTPFGSDPHNGRILQFTRSDEEIIEYEALATGTMFLKFIPPSY